MAGVIPPTPTTPTVDGAAKPLPTATIPTPPTVVSQLPLGSVLPGVIAGPASGGQIPVETPLGRVFLETPLPLPDKGAIELQLQKIQPSLTVLIRSLNGQPLALNRETLASLPSNDFASPGTPSKSSAGQSLPASGTGVTKTGEQTPSPAAPTAKTIAGAPSLPSINRLIPNALLEATLVRPSTTLSSQATPALQSGPSGADNAIGKSPAEPRIATSANLRAIALTSQSARQTGQQPGPNNHQPSQTGTRLSALRPEIPTPVRVISVLAPGANGTLPPYASSSASTLSGKVVGTRPSGQPLIETNAGLIALESRVPIKPGTMVSLEILAAGNHAVASKSPATPFGEIFATRQWPSLDESLNHLRASAPATAQQLTTTTVPQPNAQLATNILFFLTALRGGDVRQWLGGITTRILERDRPDLLQRLGDDFGSMSRSYAEPNDGRMALVPFLNGDRLEQVQMYSRGRQGQGDDDDDTPTRFIIDVNLSRLGRLQMDGFVRGKEKRFDLILRSASPLPGEMRRNITGIFTQSAEATGTAGQLIFQADAAFVDMTTDANERIDREPGLLV